MRYSFTVKGKEFKAESEYRLLDLIKGTKQPLSDCEGWRLEEVNSDENTFKKAFTGAVEIENVKIELPLNLSIMQAVNTAIDKKECRDFLKSLDRNESHILELKTGGVTFYILKAKNIDGVLYTTYQSSDLRVDFDLENKKSKLQYKYLGQWYNVNYHPLCYTYIVVDGVEKRLEIDKF